MALLGNFLSLIGYSFYLLIAVVFHKNDLWWAPQRPYTPEQAHLQVWLYRRIIDGSVFKPAIVKGARNADGAYCV